MFILDAMIDNVQTTKKTFVKTFVTNDRMAKVMNDFIDAQTLYTKEASKATNSLISSLTSETMKSMSDYTKFDYTKFGEGIMKAYQNQSK